MTEFGFAAVRYGRRVAGEARIGHVHTFLALSNPEIGTEGEPWSVDVRLELAGARADTKVWFGPRGVEVPLTEFFDGLAQDSSGWEGTREWAAYEGGLRLGATMDAFGHVTITVELREASGPDGWLVRGDVPLDAGQLEQVGSEVRRLLTP